MEINRTRVINIQRYIGDIAEGTAIRIVTDISDDIEARLERAGFPAGSGQGSTVLPAIVGRITKFNAEGRWRVRKDLPKESRYLYTRLWRRPDWQGNIHEDYVDVERDCYQRVIEPPPSVELSVHISNGRTLITSPEFVVGGGGDEIKHALNVILELFRTCEIISAGIENYTPARLETVNWRFLPPGEYPWDRLEEHLTAALRGASDETKAMIEDRAETMRGYGPDRLLVGQAGFRDYVAYEFVARGYVVLESIQRDNALYVFGRDWEGVSRLTKAEIIAGDLYEHRVIHRLGWKDRMAAIMN